jgi:hypothetical protein
MLSTKIRTTIIAAAAVAALSVPGAASAAALVRGTRTVTPIPVVKPTTTVALKEAGSAGVPGYDDKKCGFLLGEYERFHGAAEKAASYGETGLATAIAEDAGAIKGELESNCLVVD